MATFLAGFLLGAYTGAVLREEFEFPTNEKIHQAFQIFRINEAKIEESSLKPDVKPPSN